MTNLMSVIVKVKFILHHFYNLFIHFLFLQYFLYLVGKLHSYRIPVNFKLAILVDCSRSELSIDEPILLLGSPVLNFSFIHLSLWSKMALRIGLVVSHLQRPISRPTLSIGTVLVTDSSYFLFHPE